MLTKVKVNEITNLKQFVDVHFFNFNLKVSKTKFLRKQNETSGNENNHGFTADKRNKFLPKCYSGWKFTKLLKQLREIFCNLFRLKVLFEANIIKG